MDPISGGYNAPASGLGNAGLAGLGALRGPMVFPTLVSAECHSVPDRMMLSCTLMARGLSANAPKKVGAA